MTGTIPATRQSATVVGQDSEPSIEVTDEVLAPISVAFSALGDHQQGPITSELVVDVRERCLNHWHAATIDPNRCITQDVSAQMYSEVMNGVELFRLGRALMRIGEASLPEPPGGFAGHAGSTRAVLIVASDLADGEVSTVGEVAARTGISQSQVSTAVDRLREAGAISVNPDPTDRRRTLIHRTPASTARLAEIRDSSIADALRADLGSDDPAEVERVLGLLDDLARALLPHPPR